MRITVLILSLFIWFKAYAGSFYQCEVDGKKTFQDTPCKGAGVDENRIEIRVANPTVSNNERSNKHWDGMARQYDLRVATQKREVMIGMTPEQVRRSWGKPSSVNKSYVAGKSREQWVYDKGRSRNQYIYFDDGLVSAWN